MGKKNNDSCGDCKHNGDCDYRNELEKDGAVIEMMACVRYEKIKSCDNCSLMLGFCRGYGEGQHKHGKNGKDCTHHRVYDTAVGLTFGLAIEALKIGKKVCRSGWNGRGMYVVLQKGSTILNEQARGGAALELAKTLGPGEKIQINPHFSIKNVDNSISTWVPSINDCLAEDYIILED